MVLPEYMHFIAKLIHFGMAPKTFLFHEPLPSAIPDCLFVRQFHRLFVNCSIMAKSGTVKAITMGEKGVKKADKKMTKKEDGNIQAKKTDSRRMLYTLSKNPEAMATYSALGRGDKEKFRALWKDDQSGL